MKTWFCEVIDHHGNILAKMEIKAATRTEAFREAESGFISNPKYYGIFVECID